MERVCILFVKCLGAVLRNDTPGWLVICKHTLGLREMACRTVYRHYAETSQKLLRTRLFEGVADTSVVGIFASPATVSPYPNLASRPHRAKCDLCASSSYTDSWEAG